MAKRQRHHNQGQRGAKRLAAKSFIRRRLGTLSPEAHQIAEAFRLEIEGDRSGSDRLCAEAMAAAVILSRQLFKEVCEQGVVLKEVRTDRSGRIVGTRLRAHPALSKIRDLHKLLGCTAKDLGLTRESSRSRGKKDQQDLLPARRNRKVMLREADKSGLPAPDPKLFRKKPS